MIPYLVLKTGSGNKYLPLVGATCWTFGRGEENNFVLRDRWISRNHAILQSNEGGDFYLIDLGSRNGTFINGKRVSIPVTIKPGDQIMFGQTEMEFCDRNPSSNSDVAHDISHDTQTSTLHIKRLISVMVIDIRDFTVLTRQTNEEILSKVIGTWFREAGTLIRNYDSWVDKYIGDALMAIWFHSSSGPTEKEMLNILKSLAGLYKITTELSNKYPLPFPLRIGAGINTGYAMIGNTGSGDRPDYTAIGDTVNAAFRLESATKDIKKDILLGEKTYQYMSSLDIEKAGFSPYTVNLKGYDEPVSTYGGIFANLIDFLA
jgi:adenylate cyclase